MAKIRKSTKLSTDFTLGNGQAESDPLRSAAFYSSGHYSAVESREDPRCFTIGRTGSGKTAILERIEEENPEHIIRINPEDLSLPYIADLGVLKHLVSLDVHLDPFFIALWKHVLLVEIIKHRYKVDSPAAKQTFLSTLRDAIKKDKSKVAALDYLDEFEGRFWCETDERVREITSKFERQLESGGGGKVGFSGVGELHGNSSGRVSRGEETRTQQSDRFQRIVNETQIARLNKMINVLHDNILDSPQNFTYIVIDDLDRDWADEYVMNSLIRCLFRAVLDLKRVRNLKVIVALRTNIFQHLDFGRSGGQEEKFRSAALHLRWTSRELEHLLDIRIKAARTKHGYDTLLSAKEFLPAANRARGNPIDYILRRTLMRPRDVLTYVNECLTLSGGQAKLSWETIRLAERSYSRNRLWALRDEWKPSYPRIDSLFELFESAPAVMTRGDISVKFESAALLLGDADLAGVQWLMDLTRPIWDNLGSKDWERIHHPLLELLYRVGFIGVIVDGKKEWIFSQDREDFAARPGDLKRITGFVIHPAFWLALDIEKLPALGSRMHNRELQEF